MILRALIVTVFVVGCSKSGPIDELEAIAKEMCACKDAACVETVGKKLDALDEKYKDKKPADLSDADKKRLEKIQQDMGKCMMGGGGEKKPSAGGSKAQTTEAKQFLKKLVDGARAYYMEEHSSGMTPIAKQFPGPSIGPTPALGACCKDGGTKCAPDAAQWNKPQWVSLMFSVDDPHYYSYKYELSADGKTVTASAYGDLDCDGEYSTFSMTATVGPDGPTASPDVKIEKELE